MRLVVATLNYYVSLPARELLKRCLCMPYSSLASFDHAEDHKAFKVYTLKLIANMFDANKAKFNAFLLDVLMSATLTSSGDGSVIMVNNQAVVEMGITLIEHFVGSRPELVDALLLESSSERIRAWRQTLIASTAFTKSRVLATRLQLLFFRFQLSETSVRTRLSAGQVRFLSSFEYKRHWVIYAP
jgi:hypothetical protein